MTYPKIIICASVLILAIFLLLQKENTPPQIYFNNTDPISSYQFKNKKAPLRVAMISVLNHEDTAQYQKQLAAAIGRNLNRPVLVLWRRSYAEINQLLHKGNADIALLSTGAYCSYKPKEDLILLAMQERNQLPYYYGYIIVLKNSGINSLEDLRNKKFVYVDPLSYSGYLGLQENLSQHGENPEDFFSSFSFTYSHDASIRMILNGFAAGASVDSLAFDYLEKYEPQLIEKLRIIEKLPPRGTSPVVARKDLDDLARIQDILLHLHEAPDTKALLDKLMIDRFILPQPELYAPIKLREQEAIK